jgi:hypothetical protein
MSKGSGQRKKQISDEEFQKRWNNIFNSPHKRHWKKTKKKSLNHVGKSE